MLRRKAFRGLAILGLLPLAAALTVALRGSFYAPLPVDAAEPAAEAGLDELRPRGVHLVVDTYRNRLRVHRGAELLRDTVCSTGSGSELRDPESGRVWIFETPLGERRVERKERDPVWVKPDWAFIEEGMRPPPDGGARLDRLSLGDYGLYLGDGYIIHGTLFPSLLGQRITHGCIRLSDADLEYVYRTVPVGARVFLF